MRLVLYGRAALQLGFENPPYGVAQSKDVDCIIPLSDLDSLTADIGFWDAQQATNSRLLANFANGVACRRSSFLEFAALQRWQVRLLMYSSERLNTRATHIQCSSPST